MNNDWREYSGDSDYLEHFGVQGMHWGVRRYETASGKLTPAGQARYNTVDGKYQKLKSAKAAKRSANMQYNKDFAKAYNAASRLNISKKRKADRDAKMDKAIESSKEADKATKAYKQAKVDYKTSKKVAKNETERDRMLEKRAQNRDKLKAKMNKAKEKGNLEKAERMKTKIKDFDQGTKYVKAGYNQYSKTLKDYGKAKMKAIGNKETKNSEAYKVANQMYKKQRRSDMLWGSNYTKLNYAMSAAANSQKH